MLMAISGKGEAKAKGHRQGNKAAGTSAQSRMKSRAAPKLNGRTFEKLLGLFDRFAVGKELKRIVG
jgi:hypothetical protein